LTASLVLVLLAGCGGGDGDDLPREAVSGKVALDGQPLAEGAIQFLPEGGPDAKGPTVSGGAVIKGGAYDISRAKGLTPGKYKVAITSAAPADAPAADAAPGPAPKPAAEKIPAKYNASSTLTAEVKSGGGNTFDFDLSSK
jgi:hypothetical protein